jgi:hypothetical protein
MGLCFAPRGSNHSLSDGEQSGMGVSRHLYHISQHARLEIPMNLRDPSAFSPPLPASGPCTEAADLVDLPQAKALSQPEA